MKSAKQQDAKSAHKNELHFYILTINNLKRKLQKEFHLQYQNDKIFRN